MSKRIFLKKWFANPFRMGSIIPSTSSVGKCFAKNINLNKDGFIIEVGSGTGTVTESLIKHGVPEEKIICFEIDNEFCSVLAKKFPKAKVLNRDILHIDDILVELGIDTINSFVSTLPLISLGAEKSTQIMKLFARFVDSGVDYLQMSYSPFFKKKSKKYGLNANKCGYILNNFPPAYLYLCNNT
ncbi:class I SAM-dependent methyltransferase [Candidatus Cytomitobacter primus]|uniref:Methyltransferase domain-containing protein n=1 Tax=Candidatus Cytomitobacter primus TaxID=2066024 RepID=A0A5C0UFW5_9PROT|nr:rRNA adenine N-6-methyltransferase family protein [Candidatus Cytomitobacter primus]QEK38571.1 hypothetical protein FZC34_01440 [Candidatus Cytomitobacter primus]